MSATYIYILQDYLFLSICGKNCVHSLFILALSAVFLKTWIWCFVPVGTELLWMTSESLGILQSYQNISV